MSKNIIIFSGQGSQYPGMGMDILKDFPKLDYIYKIGSEIVEFDLKKAALSYTKEELSKTIVSQPMIFATSILCFEAARINNIMFNGVAGHSLGEYAALYASNCITLKEGFEIIKKRSNLMQQAADNSKGGMVAVLSKDMGKANTLIKTIDGYIESVNINSPEQTVFAGDIESIDKTCILLKENKIKAIKLPVSGAFHSNHMKSASIQFSKSISNINFKPFTKEFFSNLNGEKLDSSISINEYLGKHMSSPVLFTKELKYIKNLGYKNFIEVGCSKTLSGFIKKTLTEVDIYNIEDSTSLNKTISAINGD